VLVSKPTIVPWARSAGPRNERAERRMIHPTSRKIRPIPVRTAPKIVKKCWAGELATTIAAGSQYRRGRSGVRWY
jgi:hypothetical protein